MASKAGHGEYFTIDYDVVLWERRGWKDNDRELVALMMFAVLVCGIDAQQEIMSHRRLDTKPSAKAALDQMHRDARLFNQLRHASFRGFIKKFDVKIAKVADALDHVLFDTGRMVTEQHTSDSFDMAMDELAWLIDRLQVLGAQTFPRATSLSPIWERVSEDFKKAYVQSAPNRSELAEALRELSMAKLQCSQLQVDVDAAQADLVGEKQHVTTLKERVKTLNIAVTKREATTDTHAQKRTQQAEAQVAKLKQELSRLQDTKSKSPDGSGASKEQLDELRTKANRLQNDNSELDRSRALLTEENASLQTKLTSMRKLVEELREESNEASEPYVEKNKQLQAELDDLKAIAESLKAEKERVLSAKGLNVRISGACREAVALAKRKWQISCGVLGALAAPLIIYGFVLLRNQLRSGDSSDMDGGDHLHEVID
jgi:myosin heavy subunit